MVSFSKFVILVEINKKTEEIEVLDPNGKMIVGEMVNLQKVNLLKSQLAKKHQPEHFGYFMLRLTFWHVDFLAS
jgi:hypothetical protein